MRTREQRKSRRARCTEVRHGAMVTSQLRQSRASNSNWRAEASDMGLLTVHTYRSVMRKF